MSQDSRSQGGRPTRALKSPLTYFQYLHTAMQGEEGRRRLACVTPEAEEKLWEAEERYSTAALTLINSSTPRDGPEHNSPGQHPCTSHQPCLWLCCPAQESRTLLATLVLGWWAASRGAGASRLWPQQRWEHEGHGTTKELLFPPPFDICMCKRQSQDCAEAEG